MEVIPDFRAVDDVVRLFPELDFGVFAIVPAVANDAVRGWKLAGDVIRLGSAGDGGNGRRDGGFAMARNEFVEARSFGSEAGIGKANHVDDGGAFHSTKFCATLSGLKPGWDVTQGSSCVATLGFVAEARWASRRESKTREDLKRRLKLGRWICGALRVRG